LRAIALQPKIGVEELYAIFETEHNAVFKGCNKAEIGITPAFPNAIADQFPTGVDGSFTLGIVSFTKARSSFASFWISVGNVERNSSGVGLAGIDLFISSLAN